MSDLLSIQQCRDIIAELAALLPVALAPKLLMPDDFPESLFESEGERGRWDPVFTGGGIVNLLITDPAAPPPSRTKDIDLVLEIASYHDFVGMEELLRKAGFTQPNLSGNAPIVAWHWKGVRVDFLPHQSIPLMQTNRWFPHLLAEAERVVVKRGKSAWIASAPCFIATKFEAFHSRGRGDYLMSKDIEDIIAVVDGRSELIEETAASDRDVRGFLAQCFHGLMAEKSFIDCLPQIVPDDDREEIVLERIAKLCVTTV